MDVALSLFDQATRMLTLLRAFDRVERNQGGAGTDRETIEVFAAALDRKLRELRAELRDHSYRPKPLRIADLPKPNGGVRTLAIPSVRDRVAQTAVALTLVPLFEVEFEDVSYAYRPGRSADHAVQALMRLRDAGYTWVVDADIDSYFDSIPHDKLLATLERYVSDAEVTDLIKLWVHADVARPGGTRRLRAGIAQGSPLSPLLANLYLDALDESFLEAGHKVIRYADDFVVLAKTRPKAEAALRLSEEVLADLGLVLHPRKTRVVDFDQGFRFLGIDFLRSMAYRSRYPNGSVFLEGDDSAARVEDVNRAGSRRSGGGEPPAEMSGLVLAPTPSNPTKTSLGTAFQDALDTLPPGEATARWSRLFEERDEPEELAPPGKADPALRTLYVMTQGARVSKESERFVVQKGTRVLDRIPARQVDQLLLFGGVQVTTQALRFCLGEGIPVFLMSSRGRLDGVVESGESQQIDVVRAQFRRLEDPGFCLGTSRAIVRGKIANSRNLVQRLGREFRYRGAEETVNELDRIERRLEDVEDVDTLRGLEGLAARTYFDLWPLLLGSAFPFPGRSKHPPRDPVNALLSYGYSILWHNAYSALRVQGLHPYVGFFHTIRNNHASLASDLVEEFRAPVVDRTVLAMVRGGKARAADFEMPDAEDEYCRILDPLRKTFTLSIEQSLERRLKHPDASVPVSYREALLLQARRMREAVLGRRGYEGFVVR